MANNGVQKAQAILSQQLKDALNRIAASKPAPKSKDDREMLRTKIDSGACDPIIHPELAQDYPTIETEASKHGVGFILASGDPMPNLGERVLLVKSLGGSTIKSMRNNVVQCTGPLTSVAKLIGANNFVGFSSLGSFILDLTTGEVDWLERKDDCFELELEVVPYVEAKQHLDNVSGNSGFQGRR